MALNEGIVLDTNPLAVNNLIRNTASLYRGGGGTTTPWKNALAVFAVMAIAASVSRPRQAFTPEGRIRGFGVLDDETLTPLWLLLAVPALVIMYVTLPVRQFDGEEIGELAHMIRLAGLA